MTTDPYRDQVERLRKRIDKVSVENYWESKQLNEKSTEMLPSRSEVQRQRNLSKKKKKKLKFPLLRILLVFFILLPIASLLFYTDLLKKSPFPSSTETSTGNEFSYEIEDSGTNTDKPQESKDQEQEDADLPDEQTIDKGQKIENGETQSNSEQDSKIVYHTVQANESLYSIAMKYYHSEEGIEKIKQWNNITNDGLMVGQVLQIHLP
ncbi:LysM domain-containing protein [Heyndrickxia sporothermodurans]|uniref:LysM peptidoglycan-binding domain-containing protein n=1 Tax=Heyndrickxia sporothermodurans TaxID=46224 RepID=UPI002E1FF384|nr:LysM domain-containing protein [Heyndrickxia sporothermodurans]